MEPGVRKFLLFNQIGSAKAVAVRQVVRSMLTRKRHLDARLELLMSETEFCAYGMVHRGSVARHTLPMVLPLGDDNSDRITFPVVNLILIAVNVFIFVVLQGCGTKAAFTLAYATVPAEIVSGKDIVTGDREVTLGSFDGTQTQTLMGLKKTPIPIYLTLFTAMFMHGGIAHLIGNMWFLWIFGDNIEQDMGRVRYLSFYLLTGVLAGLTHVAWVCRGDEAMIPCLGASGAISGILGAYLVLHPHRRVMVLVWEFLVQVPGYVVIGIWFGLQFLGGLLSAGGTSDVAFGAHFGGFIAGLALAKLFVMGRHVEDGNSSWRDNRIRRKYSGGANVGSE